MPVRKGIRTRVMLVAPLVLVIAGVTIASLLIVRNSLQRQIRRDLSADLQHSMETFQHVEAPQLDALQRVNALLADLPSLKALMTTDDVRTIDDASVEFWKVSGNDLFALANAEGKVVAAFATGKKADEALRADISAAIHKPAQRYVLSNGRLFEYSVRPLYFGDAQTGTLLGYVVSGYAIDQAFVGQIGRTSGVEAAFLNGSNVVTSTLPQLLQHELGLKAGAKSSFSSMEAVDLHGERFLGSGEDLSSAASAPLQLVVLKSFDQAERASRQINTLMLIAGALAIAIGSLVMLMLSGFVTKPLELLAAGVRAFGTGETEHVLPHDGTLEVRELSASFAAMRAKIEQAKRDLVESERLATIGRMASSVSHDLRHYLAAIYANAEFLGSGSLSAQERNEIFADIRSAVHGTTDLLDSLLIFSRTGKTVRREHALIATLLERAMSLVRAHPDSLGVVFSAEYDDPTDTDAVVDERLIERAIYNLLLNACQSGRHPGEARRVKAAIHADAQTISLTITDDGGGVAESIRSSLFEPFVSEGKQKGTGLGLTIVASIAADHGGSATLVSSRPGETIFRLSVLRGAVDQPAQYVKANGTMTR